MNIGNRIEARRQELGLPVSQVARVLKLHKVTVYRWESRDMGISARNLVDLYRTLKTDPNRLLGRKRREQMEKDEVYWL